MSRSAYVYVVLRAVSRVPVITFTVKHELSAWMKRHGYPQKVEVYRLRDGKLCPDQIPVRLDPQTLEPMETAS